MATWKDNLTELRNVADTTLNPAALPHIDINERNASRGRKYYPLQHKDGKMGRGLGIFSLLAPDETRLAFPVRPDWRQRVKSELFNFGIKDDPEEVNRLAIDFDGDNAMHCFLTKDATVAAFCIRMGVEFYCWKRPNSAVFSSCRNWTALTLWDII